MGIVISLTRAREARIAVRNQRALVKGHLFGSRRPQSQARAPWTQDWSTALRTAQRMLQEAGRARNLAGLAEAHSTLAMLATGRGDWFTAAMHAVASLELGTVYPAICHLILGLHQIQSRESAPLAMRLLRVALNSAEQAGDTEMQRLALAGLAIHCLVRNHPSAAQFFLSRWNQLRPSGDTRWRACWLAISAWTTGAHGNLPSGLAQQATALAFSGGDDLTALFAHWALTEHYTVTGQGEAAALCYEQSRRHLAQWLDGLSPQAVIPGDLLPMSVLGLVAMLGQARLSERVGTACRPAAAGGKERSAHGVTSDTTTPLHA